MDRIKILFRKRNVGPLVVVFGFAIIGSFTLFATHAATTSTFDTYKNWTLIGTGNPWSFDSTEGVIVYACNTVTSQTSQTTKAEFMLSGTYPANDNFSATIYDLQNSSSKPSYKSGFFTPTTKPALQLQLQSNPQIPNEVLFYLSSSKNAYGKQSFIGNGITPTSLHKC